MRLWGTGEPISAEGKNNPWICFTLLPVSYLYSAGFDSLRPHRYTVLYLETTSTQHWHLELWIQLGEREKKHLDGGWGCFGSFVAAMNKKLLLEVVLYSATISPPVKPTNPAFLIPVKSYSIMKQLTGRVLTDIEQVLLPHSLCDQSSFLACTAPLHTDSGSGLQWLFSPHPPTPEGLIPLSILDCIALLSAHLLTPFQSPDHNRGMKESL